MTAETRGDAQGSRAPAWFITVAVALALLLVAAVGAAWYSWRYVESDNGRTAQDQAAVAAARQFVLEVNSYKVSDVSGYQARVDPLMTGSFGAEFDQATSKLFPQLAKSGLSTSGTVLQAGVSNMDPDSATVLVAADATAKSTIGTTTCTRVRHFRWAVDLQNISGAWKVSKYQQYESQPTNSIPCA
ncbi:MAG: hypothetical protein ACRDP1_00165 [Nocardioidaceae bacterium]